MERVGTIVAGEFGKESNLKKQTQSFHQEYNVLRSVGVSSTTLDATGKD